MIYFHPPEFFPPLEFFYGLVNSKVWVALDHIRFTSRSKQNRCRIKNGESITLLAVSVKRPCSRPICEMVIDNVQPWRQYFLKTLRGAYEGAPYFRDYFEDIKYYIESPNVLLETLTLQTTLWAAEQMGKRLPLIRTSEHYRNWPTLKVIPILVKKLGDEPFSDRFEYPIYLQQTEPFESNLSILDALFNIGAEETKRLLLNGDGSGLPTLREPLNL